MKTFVAGKPHWWQWLTVLSLDAPAVALLWQWLLARVAEVTLRPAHVVVLGSSVWLAYAADRWIEGWRLAPSQVQTQRHAFYQRWRWSVATVWLLVLLADVGTAIIGLSHREFCAGLLLILPVGAYLLSHQLIHRHRRWRAPKEICVATLLGAGVALFLVAQPSVSWRPLAMPLGLFTLLCFANCALISVWEHEVDQSHGAVSLTVQFRGSAGFSRALPWLLAVVAGMLFFYTTGEVRVAVGCALTSGILLGTVDRAESRLRRQLARVLADVSLFTPLLPLLREALS